jgi:hypothetical protein
MNCENVREQLPELAAGHECEVPGINEHVSTCAACAGELKELQSTMALLDEWQASEPSAYFNTRLMARVREEKAKAPAGWLQWFRKPALAVSFAVLMVASITAVRITQTHHETIASGPVEPGTAVGDLQALDKNHDLLFSDSDVLDDLQVQDDVTATP